MELKSVVDDVERRRAILESAGAKLVYAGSLDDRRYDTADGALAMRDEVLRLRVYSNAHGERAELNWKGPTRKEGGFKLREEIGTRMSDASAIESILEKLGYVVTMQIQRVIAQYDLHGATIRFEHYPRMDDLVEVEGTAEQIERAIEVMGLPRSEFVTDRLSDFVMRYEARTGSRAALSAAASRDFDIANA
jgi:predicted adenylyl cyclase CyaB